MKASNAVEAPELSEEVDVKVEIEKEDSEGEFLDVTKSPTVQNDKDQDKQLTDTPETSMEQFSDDEVEDYSSSPVVEEAKEQVQDVLAVPALAHSGVTKKESTEPAAVAAPEAAASPTLALVPSEDSDEQQGYVVSNWMSHVVGDMISSAMASEEKYDFESVVGNTEKEVIEIQKLAGGDDSSVDSSAPVIPNYSKQRTAKKNKPKKPTRTLETLFGASADSTVGGDSTDDDIYHDDDGGYDGSSVVEDPFDALWDGEDAPTICSELKHDMRQIQDNISVNSDAASSFPTLDNQEEKNDASHSNNSNSHGEVSNGVVSSGVVSQSAETSKMSNVVRSTAASLFGGIRGNPDSPGRRKKDDESATSGSAAAKEKFASAVSGLQKSMSEKLTAVGETVTPAVSNISKNISSVSQSVTKGILSRAKSVNSAAETTCATNTTTNHEMSTATPDIEMQLQEEEVILEEGSHGDGENTISSHSSGPKEEVLNPRNMLWIIILSMVVCIIIVFVAVLCVFAIN